MSAPPVASGPTGRPDTVSYSVPVRSLSTMVSSVGGAKAGSVGGGGRAPGKPRSTVSSPVTPAIEKLMFVSTLCHWTPRSLARCLLSTAREIARSEGLSLEKQTQCGGRQLFLLVIQEIVLVLQVY